MGRALALAAGLLLATPAQGATGSIACGGIAPGSVSCTRSFSLAVAVDARLRLLPDAGFTGSVEAQVSDALGGVRLFASCEYLGGVPVALPGCTVSDDERLPAGSYGLAGNVGSPFGLNLCLPYRPNCVFPSGSWRVGVTYVPRFVNTVAIRTPLHPGLRRCSSVTYPLDMLPPRALHSGRRMRPAHQRIYETKHYAVATS